MRQFFLPFCVLVAVAGAGDAAVGAVAITIDKNAQQMTVAVDGEVRHRWPVSTGLPSYETPNGEFRAFRMEADHYSKEWDDAPMPHSIFFTKSGHAIHGTDVARRLGNPASHGCVRLSRANAATLFALVEREGVLNTTVKLMGSSQIALARAQRQNEAVVQAPRQALPQRILPPAVDDGDDAAAYADAGEAPVIQQGRMWSGDAPRYEGPSYDPAGRWAAGRQYYTYRGYAPPTVYLPARRRGLFVFSD